MRQAHPNCMSIGTHTLSQSHTPVEHDVFGALHLVRFFLRPSSRAPAVERVESADACCKRVARRCWALRGVARRCEAPQHCEALRGVARRMHTLSQSHTSVWHAVFGALHFIRFVLRPSSRAPAVERIESARCVLQARCQALRGAARRRSFAKRCADPVGKRRRARPEFPALCGLRDKYTYPCSART